MDVLTGKILDHQDIIKLFNDAWDSDRDNREDGLEDLRFIAGDQWDPTARSEREAASRPIVTINRMGQFVRQVTGDMRLNPVAINVSPVDNEDDVDKAEIFEGIIRKIESASNARSAYTHAFECSAGVGIGHFRINTQYVRDTVADQEITVERIMNPYAVVWDPSAIKIDRSDAKFCFVTDLISRREFKLKYPDADVTDFQRGTGAQTRLYWNHGETVRVSEFWVKEEYKRTLALTNAGDTLDITGVKKSDAALMGIAQQRTFTDYRVRQYIISGSEILSGPTEWAGRDIPIVPTVGTELPVDEKVIRHGIIRWAKDPQVLYNYYRSSQAELIGQQPRSPFLLTPKMIKGFEAQWNNANTNPRPWLPYNPDKDVPGGQPKREAPPQASAALWQEAAVAQDDMKATTGIYDASLGAKSNETSGVAISARQREGDVGSYHYFDNFKFSIKRAGEILLDLIPKIYDTDRVIKIIGAEEKDKFVNINQQVSGVDGFGVIDEVLNDLSVGRFDVRVSSGPAFSTMRQEAQAGMLDAAKANPALWQVAGDLMIEAMDWPKAKEISERLRKTIPPELLDGDDQDQEQQAPQPPDPMQQQAIQMQLSKAEAEIRKTNAQAEESEMKAESTAIENEVKVQFMESVSSTPG